MQKNTQMLLLKKLSKLSQNDQQQKVRELEYGFEKSTKSLLVSPQKRGSNSPNFVT